MTYTGLHDRVPVLIASPLEHEHVDRIAAAEPDRVVVLYEPSLLPKPRYVADHGGIRPALSEEQQAQWLQLLAQAEVLFDFDWYDPSNLLQRAPHLRWIQATSAGIADVVGRLNIPRNAVQITTAAGVHAQALAEFVLMAMLFFAKDLPALLDWQARHHWERYCGHELADRRALVIGLGAVGGRISSVCSALGVHVVGLRRTYSGDMPAGVERLIRQEELDETIPMVDFLIIAAPGTVETRHLIDAARLERLAASAVLINVGRGNIVDEQALVERLRYGQLRGAALDVFEREPLSQDSPLWDMPNVLISPHSASTVDRENQRIVDLFIENLHRYLDRRTLINQFDFERQY